MDNPQRYLDQGFGGACRMAYILACWDDRASLPLVKDLMKECRARSDRWLEQEHPANFDRSLASNIVEFTQIRLKLGDLAALDRSLNRAAAPVEAEARASAGSALWW